MIVNVQDAHFVFINRMALFTLPNQANEIFDYILL